MVEAWDPTPDRKMILNLPTTVEVTDAERYARSHRVVRSPFEAAG